MLLINDYKSQVRLRCKNGTAGTDDDIKLTIPDAMPLVKSLPQRELAVKNRYLVGKT